MLGMWTDDDVTRNMQNLCVAVHGMEIGYNFWMICSLLSAFLLVMLVMGANNYNSLY